MSNSLHVRLQTSPLSVTGLTIPGAYATTRRRRERNVVFPLHDAGATPQGRASGFSRMRLELNYHCDTGSAFKRETRVHCSPLFKFRADLKAVPSWSQGTSRTVPEACDSAANGTVVVAATLRFRCRCGGVNVCYSGLGTPFSLY